MGRKELLESTLTMNYLSFISGIQVGACITLLVNLYDTSLYGLKLGIVIFGCIFIFFAGYLSALISWKINNIITEGHRAKGTLVHPNEIMDEMLGKKIQTLFGTYSEEQILTGYFCFDIILSLGGVALILSSKFI